MYDYMQELQRTFFEEPDCSSLRQEIDILYQKISLLLSEEDHRTLLALVDHESALRDEISFANFIAGFRLASGLAMELSCEKPCSFYDAEEHRV